MGFLSFRNALIGGAALGALTLGADPAKAVVVDFGFGVATIVGQGITYTPQGDIGHANTVINMSHIGSYTSPFVGVLDTTNISGAPSINWFTPINFIAGGSVAIPTVTETFPSTSGTYTATFTKVFADVAATSTGLSLVFQGKLTGGLLGATTQDVFLSAAFTNVDNDNTHTTSVSFTESSTPPRITTPEPASMAILGVGLAALGAARRRKRAS